MLKEYEVGFLQAEIKKNMDDYNKFLLEKEQNYQEFTACDIEMKNLVAQIQELENRGTKVLKTVN